MPNKNRKLILRDIGQDDETRNNELVKAFSPEFIEALRVEAERAMRELPDDAWLNNADENDEIRYLVRMYETQQEGTFWELVDELFVVEPLNYAIVNVLEREKSELESRSREIEAEIARLRSEG